MPLQIWLIATMVSVMFVSILLWRFSPIRVKIVVHRVEAPEPQHTTDNIAPPRFEKSNDSSSKRTERPPFKFRDRLRHEPPDLDYGKYEVYDEVQKEFKNVGGKDLEWRTRWLDTSIERNLLWDYRGWISALKRSNEFSDKDEAFYDDLRGDIYLSLGEVFEEWQDDADEFGKTFKDRRDLFEYVESIKKERMEGAGIWQRFKDREAAKQQARSAGDWLRAVELL